LRNSWRPTDLRVVDCSIGSAGAPPYGLAFWLAARNRLPMSASDPCGLMLIRHFPSRLIVAMILSTTRQRQIIAELFKRPGKIEFEFKDVT
jgi:hypothetical protein